MDTFYERHALLFATLLATVGIATAVWHVLEPLRMVVVR